MNRKLSSKSKTARHICLICPITGLLAQKWASGHWNADFERSGGNLRFFERLDAKIFLFQMNSNANLLHFMYGFLTHQNFQKRRLGDDLELGALTPSIEPRPFGPTSNNWTPSLIWILKLSLLGSQKGADCVWFIHACTSE